MKQALIFLINLYRKVGSPLLDNVFGPRKCRFDETCSGYSRRVILEYGVLRGLYLSMYRILRCQPFFSLNPKYESI